MAMERMAVFRRLNTSIRVCRKAQSRETLSSRCWCQNIFFTFHPYLFKDAGFRFEEEVRFVLRGNLAVTSRSNGALLDIAATDIIRGTGFDVSEELPHSEQGLIRLLGIDFLQHGLTLPSFPISSSGSLG